MKQRSKSASDRLAPGTQAVVRAVAILKAFDGQRAEWGLSELAASLSLHKTTVFRLLGALERAGFVARDAARETYRLGPELIALGALAVRSTDLHAAARPVLESLAADTSETTTLEVLVDDDALILDEVQGRFLVGSLPEVGGRFPAHTTSTGKALLAARFFESADAKERALPRGRLARLGPNTITTRAQLERELTESWRRGYAVARDEVEAGFTAIGAVVRNHEGRVVAAISIGGPSSRFTPSRIGELAVAVRAAADQISRRLGAPAATLALPVAPPTGALRSARGRVALGRA